MPQIGPDFLHRPLKGPSLLQLRGAIAWLADGFRTLAPRRLKEYGWAAVEERVLIDEAFAVTTLGVVERSLLGAERLRPSGGSRPDLPAVAALDASLIYETVLDLPAEARASLKKTVALRMDDISPVPPGDALFAVGEEKSRRPGRMAARVAIVKKTTVDTVERLLDGRPIGAIGAETGAGERRYVFKDFRKLDMSRAGRWFAAAISLWLAFLLLGGALERRAGRTIDAFEAYETRLHEDIRAVRADKETLAALQGSAPPATTGADMLRAVETVLAQLPAGGVIEAVEYDNNRIVLSGLAPHGGAADAASPLRRSASDFPGHDRFQIGSSLTSTDSETER